MRAASVISILLGLVCLTVAVYYLGLYMDRIEQLGDMSGAKPHVAGFRRIAIGSGLLATLFLAGGTAGLIASWVHGREGDRSC